MKLSDAGAHLIESFEGFSAKPYRDAVGVWTIGFGSTAGVGPNTPHVTREQAEERLKREVDEQYGAAVNALRLPLNQSQFDALVSFVYNVGPGGIGANTGVGRALRRHDWQAAANALLAWDKAGGRTLLGLTRRRQAERALFLRTPKVDPLAGYTAAERRWIREFDALRRKPKTHRSAADEHRMVVLGRVMRTQRKRIWRAAQASGWDVGHRRQRYRSMLVRSKA